MVHLPFQKNHNLISCSSMNNKNKTDISLFSIHSSFIHPPLGIASLASYLGQKGLTAKPYNVSLPQEEKDEYDYFLQKAMKEPELFLILIGDKVENTGDPEFTQKYNNLRKILSIWVDVAKRDDPLAIGISILNRNLFLSLAFAKLIREELKDCKIILGGPECQDIRLIKHFLEHNLADVVIQGEGEDALYKILVKIKKGDFSKTTGSMIKTGDEVLCGEAPAPLNIDSLTPPVFEGFSPAKYPDMILPFAFVRGCVYKCKFCTDFLYWESFRQMEVSQAVEQLRHLKKTYNARKFYFCQPMINTHLDWLAEFSQILIKNKLNILWGGFARIDVKMDKDFLKTLYKGGCRFFHFGVESGSKKLLNKMNKGIQPDNVSKVIQSAVESGMWVSCSFIIGYPGETEEDILQTLYFILENSQHIDQLEIAQYVPDNERVKHETSETTDIIDYFKKRKRSISYLSVFYQKNRRVLQKFIRVFKENVISVNLPEKDKSGTIWSKRFNGSLILHEKGACYYKRLTATHLLMYYLLNESSREVISGNLNLENFNALFADFSKKNELEKIHFNDRNARIGESLYTLLREQKV